MCSTRPGIPTLHAPGVCPLLPWMRKPVLRYHAPCLLAPQPAPGWESNFWRSPLLLPACLPARKRLSTTRANCCCALLELCVQTADTRRPEPARRTESSHLPTPPPIGLPQGGRPHYRGQRAHPHPLRAAAAQPGGRQGGDRRAATGVCVVCGSVAVCVAVCGSICSVWLFAHVLSAQQGGMQGLGW